MEALIEEAFTKAADFYPMSSYEVEVGGLTAAWSISLSKWKVVNKDGKELAIGVVPSDEKPETHARKALADQLKKLEQ